MTLEQRIQEELKKGGGLKIGNRCVVRNVGRKEAQQAKDAPTIQAYDESITRLFPRS